MFARLGTLVTAHARRILVVTGLVLVVALAFGVQAPGRLLGAGFVSPSSPSQQAANRLDADFKATPNLVFLVTARQGSVDDPGVAAAGTALAGRVAAQPGVASVVSYWGTHLASLRGEGGRAALVVVDVAGNDQQVAKRTKALVDRFDVPAHRPGPVTVAAGGPAAANNAISAQVGGGLAKSEGLAIPLTALLLVLAFGSLVAAGLPLVAGVCSILATLALLFGISQLTSVSVYSLNMTTAMGLGLGIDSALLIVNRFREELHAGRSREGAIRRSVETAGRTVVFSVATIAAVLATLLVFPMYFLRSFAYAGISVVVAGALGAVVVLPAVLTLLGERVNAVPVRRRVLARPAESRFWRRVASGVMRRPVAAGLPVLAVFLVLAVPLLHVRFGPPDDRVVPASIQARQVDDALRTQFPLNATNTLDVVTTARVPPAAAAAYSAALSRLAGVDRVDGPAGPFVDGHPAGSPALDEVRYQRPQASWFSAVIHPDPLSRAAGTLVRQARALPPPAGTRAYVGGQAASFVDQVHDLGAQLPLALVLVVVVTFVVLFLFTGSVVLPLKAIVLNALNLGAVFGVLVWIFQEGHLSGVLGFTAEPVNTTMPVLLFCLVFGLSMDYEVFLLSRIKELHDAGAPNAEAVAGGLARTGRIMTTAAGILAVSFFAIALSDVSFMKLFGIGTGLAILLDATVVRGVLVPAFMRVAGEWNWWSPASLRRVHRRLRLSGEGVASPAVG